MQLPANHNSLGRTQRKQIFVHELQNKWGWENRNGTGSRYKKLKTKQRKLKAEKSKSTLKSKKKKEKENKGRLTSKYEKNIKQIFKKCNM